MTGKLIGMMGLAGAAALGYAWAGERPQMRLDRYEIALPGGVGAGLRLLHLADQHLGWVTAAAIIAHEIPQEVGDYIVLLNAGFSRGKALLFNALSGLAAVLGGLLGYFIVGPWESMFPYLLVLASSSFIYVAVADLIPQLQRRLPWKETAAQMFWLAAGMGFIVLVLGSSH